jgi:V8-like Glu-specific endopeptidase
MQNAQSSFLTAVEHLLEENEVEKALDALLELDERTKAGIRQDVILQSGSYKEASRMFHRNLISFEEYTRISAKTRYGLLELMKELPDRIRLNAQSRNIDSFQFDVPDDGLLEKILGDRSNLLRINWLEKALIASRAVCRIVCADGSMGTGFLTAEGYLFTNCHVLPNAREAQRAHAEFNYELDAAGQIKNRVRYELDAADYRYSPADQLDFARVRIIDRPDAPLRQWGFLEFETGTTPAANEPVTIIQHPGGSDKQIALHANDVISVWDRYIFYTTDTEPGSSGSPVFNKEWKVVALHHAGKSDAEGGLQINARGDRRAANRGILFQHIFRFLAGDTRSSAPDPALPQTEETKPKTATTPNPTPAPSNPPGAIPRFIVLYDELDKQLCDRLNNHLFVLKSTKKIEAYNVHRAKAGEDVEARAREELAKADYVLILITANLFNEEAPWFGMAIEALQQGKRVIPIRLDKVNFDGTGLEKLRALPTMNRAVSEFANADEGYDDIVQEIKKLL